MVDVIDPLKMFGLNKIISILIWHFGAFGLASVTYLYVRALMRAKSYEFCVVNHGETISPALVRFLKKRCTAVTCYNADNPFVTRDRRKWRIALQALPYYDSFCTPRASSMEQAYARGAKHVIWFTQAADEVVHRPREFNVEDSKKYSSDVAFVGTWMPERGVFVAELLKAGVPIKIFGANWTKAAEYEQIKPAIVINGFLGDEDYVRAIQYSKILLGMLSEENEDLHTGRSVEIPAIGSLLCAKRTEQHISMYVKGCEAVFWDGAVECTRICLELLENPSMIDSISKAGNEKMMKSRYFNQPLMERIISETLSRADVSDEGGLGPASCAAGRLGRLALRGRQPCPGNANGRRPEGSHPTTFPMAVARAHSPYRRIAAALPWPFIPISS
jgi:spore maturation protein CgeB